jgi:hypothetical protein
LRNEGGGYLEVHSEGEQRFKSIKTFETPIVKGKLFFPKKILKKGANYLLWLA